MPTRPVRRPRAVRTTLAATLVILAGTVVAGCGATPPTIGATGVDGLTVPTPSPAPGDFAPEVDHPLLPLAPGDRWELADPAGDARLVVEVGAARRTVAGIPATALRVASATGPMTTAWLAQDDDGHVWLLAGAGPGGAWSAGEDGAVAGLVLAADPRVGDGYALWSVDGEPQAAAEVLSLDEELAVPWGVVEGVATLELDLDLLREGPDVRVALATSVGPVAVEDLVTGEELVLVARS